MTGPVYHREDDGGVNYIDLNEPQTAIEKLKLLAEQGRPVTLDAKAVLELHERVARIETLLQLPPVSVHGV